MESILPYGPIVRPWCGCIGGRGPPAKLRGGWNYLVDSSLRDNIELAEKMATLMASNVGHASNVHSVTE